MYVLLDDQSRVDAVSPQNLNGMVYAPDHVGFGYVFENGDWIIDQDEITRRDKIEQAELDAKIKGEVSRRILLYASLSTQMNLTAAAAAELLTPAQKSAYRSGLQWIADMRRTGQELTAKRIADFEADKHWPIISPQAVELAQAY